MAASVSFTDVHGRPCRLEVLSVGVILTAYDENSQPRATYLSKKKARLAAQWILKNVPKEKR